MPPSYPAGSYPAKVVADGAVAYWRLGETSGTTAVDVIGGANGTISGGVTLGQSGALADADKAMAFDGTTGTILTAASITLPVTCTLELWIKTTDARLNTTLLSNRFIVQDGIVGIFVNSSGGLFIDSYQGTNNVISSVPVVTDGIWHHVVWTNNGSLGTVYIDSQLTISQAQPHTSLAAPFQIAFDTFQGLYLNSTIDEVAIYPTALTAPQIAAHYAAKDWTAFGPAYQEMRYRWCRYVAGQVRR